MWDLVKSGTLWVTRPARVAYSSRKKGVREYEPRPVLAVEVSDSIDLESQVWIQSALAFSAPSHTIELIQANKKSSEKALEDYLETHLDKRPSAFLFIGTRPTQEQISALKVLQIPFRAIKVPEPPENLENFPAEDLERAKWHQAFGRRHVIYAHFERVEPVAKAVEAFRIARRNYPDLLFVVSGVSPKDIPYKQYGFICVSETTRLENVDYADILVLKSKIIQPVLSSVAMVQLVTQMRGLRKVAHEAIMRAATVVFYDVRPQSLGSLSELTQGGTVWSVRKRESLGAALSQALSLEEVAKTNAQSISRLTNEDSPLLKAIDALIGQDRAA